MIFASIYTQSVVLIWKRGIVMVDVSNQHWNEDGSITIILNSIEEVEELVECVNICNKMCEDEE